MQDLNKSQFVLLVLLITFVTSIATGIITVSLLQQAPVEVTRNINQIVEKTIQNVVPKEIIASVRSEPQTKEITTVVVKEDDMIVATISKNSKSVARITQIDEAGVETFGGMAWVISKDGLLVADRRLVMMNTSYRAKLSDGTNVPLSLVPTNKSTNFVLFKPTDIPANKKLTFTPMAFNDGDLQLGQTIVSLGGDTVNASSVGRVISLSTKDVAVGTSTEKQIVSIETDVSAKDLIVGSPLFNLSGNVVGMKSSDNGAKVFTPVYLVQKDIDAILAAE